MVKIFRILIGLGLIIFSIATVGVPEEIAFVPLGLWMCFSGLGETGPPLQYLGHSPSGKI